MSKITPCLWIPVTPEEAVAYYKSIFANVTAEGLNQMTGGVTPAPGPLLEALTDKDHLVFFQTTCPPPVDTAGAIALA